jgi:LuxR family maltose regulon positive regulatory protein
VAWLSLDERDNHLSRFLGYLTAALQRIEPSLAAANGDHLPMPVLDEGTAQLPSWAESALHTLLNDLAKLPEPVVLVLDDYQVIRQPNVHAAVALLVEHLPAQMHLVILTRSDPPFSVAQLHGRGQITELRQKDLQFTLEESGEFLQRNLSLDLTEQQIGALVERTEGWIAGLQMTAASLCHRSGPALSGFIADFSDSNRFIFDYLLDEVLHQQPAAIQAFLLRTAILDRLTGSLCDYVMSNHEGDCQDVLPGQHILEQLERSNLFLVPLDDNHQWYRYHHLFSALLRHRLQVLHPDLVPELHWRASIWYQENGLIDQAIQHALASGQDGLAAHLAEQAAEETLQQGHVTRFLDWLEALPAPILDRHPRLRVYQIGLQLFTGQALEVVERGLQAVLDAHAPDGMAGEVAAFQALVAVCQGDRARSQALARTALEHMSQESAFLRGLVAGLLGFCDLVQGEITQARQAFQDALAVGQASGNPMLTTLALCHQGDLSLLASHLHEAAGFYRQALTCVSDRHGRRLPVAGLALIGLGRVHLERLELDLARRSVSEGLELVASWGAVAGLMGLVELSLIRQLQGAVAQANALMQQARQMAARFDAMQLDDAIVDVYQVRLWLLQGNLQAAGRWARDLGNSRTSRLAMEIDHGQLSCHRALHYLTLAQVLEAEGRPVEALSLSSLLRPVAEHAGWNALVIELLTLEALCHSALGHPRRALEVLDAALQLAEPEGHVLVFATAGAPMAKLLYQKRSLGVCPDQVNGLVAAWNAQHEIAETTTESAGEPLSQRELQVLRLIGQGLTNQQIADRLVIALSTVKSHINHIYRKLDVARRTEALLQARTLSLL